MLASNILAAESLTTGIRPQQYFFFFQFPTPGAALYRARVSCSPTALATVPMILLIWRSLLSVSSCSTSLILDSMSARLILFRFRLLSNLLSGGDDALSRLLSGTWISDLMSGVGVVLSGMSLVCSGLSLVLDARLPSSVCLLACVSLVLDLSGLLLVLDSRLSGLLMLDSLLSFLSWLAGHLAFLLSSIMLRYAFL